MNIVITGTSRGIGLEMAHQALDRGDQVLAVARLPERSRELQDLRRRYGRLIEIFTADFNYPETVSKVALVTERWSHVDMLINNAGVFRQGESLRDFNESFQINAVMPFMLAKSLLPALKKSSSPRVVQITSRMGSISDNKSGGYYVYRASKAALNMINKSMAADHPWLTTVVIHPGWVKTDMGGREALVEVQDSAAGILRIAREIQLKDSGKFFDYQGNEVPW